MHLADPLLIGTTEDKSHEQSNDNRENYCADSPGYTKIDAKHSSRKEYGHHIDGRA